MPQWLLHHPDRNNYDVISIRDAAFTLTDCKGTGLITHAEGISGAGIYLARDEDGSPLQPELYMYGGIIANNSTKRAGGIEVLGTDYALTKFNMYGGKICGNSCEVGGGIYFAAVSSEGGSRVDANIYDGEI